MGGKKKERVRVKYCNKSSCTVCIQVNSRGFLRSAFWIVWIGSTLFSDKRKWSRIGTHFVFFSPLAVSLMTLFIQRLESCCKLCHKVQSAPPPPSEATEPQAICNKCYHLLPSDYYYNWHHHSLHTSIQANWWWQVLHSWKISCKKFGIWKNIDWFICKVRQDNIFPIKRMKSWES